MSAHLRLLSAAALPVPSALRRARPLPPAPRLHSARARLFLRSSHLFPRAAVRSRCVAVESAAEGGELELEVGKEEEGVLAPDAGIWEQVRDVVVFAGPALGLWICGPLMSLIDTMVIGQTSSLQLAALGPYYFFCSLLNCFIPRACGISWGTILACCRTSAIVSLLTKRSVSAASLSSPRQYGVLDRFWM